MPERDLSAAYPTDLPAWQALQDHYANDMQSKSLADLFGRNQQRFAGYSLEAGDLFLDYSKNFLNAKTKKTLTKLATENRGSCSNRVHVHRRGDQQH